MQVKAEDRRPPSLLTEDPWDGWSILGGVSSVFAVAVVLPALLGVFAALAVALATEEIIEESEPPIAENVIAAEFVRLGRPPDPHRMPDRVVPIQASAPIQETVLSKRTVEPRERPEEETPPPPEAVDDPIRRLADRARAFAELAEARELEGHPEGIEGGTAEEAREGDLYAGHVKVLMSRGWTLPVTLNLAEVETLRAMVVVEFDSSLRLVGFRIVRPSGHALFDQSVLDHLQRLQQSGTRLPDPPSEAVAEEYRNSGRRLNFNGSDAR